MDMEPTGLLETTGWEDASLSVRAYITGNDRAAVTQASLASSNAIVAHVYDLSNNGAEITPALAIDKTTTILDTPDSDDDGEYNFDATIAGTYFPNGPRTYLIEIVFTPATGSPFPLVIKHTTQGLTSS